MLLGIITGPLCSASDLAPITDRRSEATAKQYELLKQQLDKARLALKSDPASLSLLSNSQQSWKASVNHDVMLVCRTSGEKGRGQSTPLSEQECIDTIKQERLSQRLQLLEELTQQHQVASNTLFYKLTKIAKTWQTIAPQTKHIDGVNSVHTYWPEIGIRGFYNVAAHTVPLSVLENLIGESVYISGPHQNGLDVSNDKQFGHYNPDFLKELKIQLAALYSSPLFISATQNLYDERLKTYLRLYQQSYDKVAGNLRLAQLYDFSLHLHRDTPHAAPNEAIDKHLTRLNLFHENGDSHWTESHSVPRFWVRRTIDNTYSLFYELLMITLKAYDPAFYQSIEKAPTTANSRQRASNLTSWKNDRSIELYKQAERDYSSQSLITISIMISAFKAGDKKLIAEHFISYPFTMPKPLLDIRNSSEMLSRFDEVFDKAMFDSIANSSFFEWEKAGWRGFMFKQGQVWASEGDFKLFRVSTNTPSKQQALAAATKAEQKKLHPSIANYERPILSWNSERFNIRIDYMGESGYRYAVWPGDKFQSNKPDLILYNGTDKSSGSINWYSYHFKNGKYHYTVSEGGEGSTLGHLSVDLEDKNLLHVAFFQQGARFQK